MEIINGLKIPANMVREEIDGIYGGTVIREMNDIIKLYGIYERGADFTMDRTMGYTPANVKYKKIKGLIDKESRFLFSNTPDFQIQYAGTESKIPENDKESINDWQRYLSAVLADNGIGKKLICAARDCFIGKRVAILCNINQNGVSIDFIPSLEFVYDVDKYGKLTKIIGFFAMTDSMDRNLQRIYKKKYWLQNGFCHVTEGIYDGTGTLVESVIEDLTTKFQYIPAAVIINEGLTGDLNGESDVSALIEYEAQYSKLANADVDSERQSMNPIRYTVDMDSKSTSGLSAGAGAFWDLQSDGNSSIENVKGQVGMLESSMQYKDAVDTTLKRISNTMHELLDIPNINIEDMQGIITSGKALKAVYWGLIVRCDEKMLTWKPALEFMVKCIIDSAVLYPEFIGKYIEKLPQLVKYKIDIENNYPIPEDENEEKANDLADVQAQTMSKKRYMKKWQGLTDEEAEAEIQQIMIERQWLEDNYGALSTSPLEDVGGEPK